MPKNDESILDSIKKVLDISEDYDVFDSNILMGINSTFATLQQLGVGPDTTFYVEDDQKKWSDFIGDAENIASVKSYVFLCVKLLFDPPSTSFVLDALKEQKKEFEWRLNVVMEGERHPNE